MKNTGAGIAVAATYGLIGFLSISPDTWGPVTLLLIFFAALCTWKLVSKSD